MYSFGFIGCGKIPYNELGDGKSFKGYSARRQVIVQETARTLVDFKENAYYILLHLLEFKDIIKITSLVGKHENLEEHTDAIVGHRIIEIFLCNH